MNTHLFRSFMTTMSLLKRRGVPPPPPPPPPPPSLSSLSSSIEASGIGLLENDRRNENHNKNTVITRARHNINTNAIIGNPSNYQTTAAVAAATTTTTRIEDYIGDDNDDDDDDDDYSRENKKLKHKYELQRRTKIFIVTLSLLTLIKWSTKIIILPTFSKSSTINYTSSITTPFKLPQLIPQSAIPFQNDTQVALQIDWAVDHKRNTGKPALGMHKATLYIAKPTCPDPRFVLRFIGDQVILSVPIIQQIQIDNNLQQQKQQQLSIWKAHFFEIPFEGDYHIDARWYGCYQQQQQQQQQQLNHDIHTETNNKDSSVLFSYQGLPSQSSTVQVYGPRKLRNNGSINHSTPPLYIHEGFWVSPTTLKNQYHNNQKEPQKIIASIPNERIWISPVPMRKITDPTMLTVTTPNKPSISSVVIKETVGIPHEFSNLSNYELVCWIGDDSGAKLVWEAFKSLRPQIDSKQLAFKFHYYPITTLSNPDQSWTDETKLRFRKCKNILLSFESFQGTQSDYMTALSKFITHLHTAFDDYTFPIWILTVNRSPVDFRTTCSSPTLPRTNHHPCNEALFRLFDDNGTAGIRTRTQTSTQSPMFHKRIRLLDNTDLTSPLLLDDTTSPQAHIDAIAVIALRIFVLVGEQVKIWRQAGQRGTKEGLKRNGRVEPNPVFDIYKFD